MSSKGPQTAADSLRSVTESLRRATNNYARVQQLVRDGGSSARQLAEAQSDVAYWTLAADGAQARADAEAQEQS